MDLLIFAFPAAFGLLGLSQAVPAFFRARASRTWAQSVAVITHASFERRRHSRFAPPFIPRITYRYTFLGREYVGHNLAFGVSSVTAEDAEALEQRFAPGTEWEVRVCDRRPSVAVLHPGATPPLRFRLMFFSAFTIISVAALIDAFFRLK